MKHCGRERKGNFCMECGAPLHSLIGLIRHIKKTVAMYKRRAMHDVLKASRSTSEENRTNYQRTADKNQRMEEKWKTWLEQLILLTGEPSTSRAVTGLEKEVEEMAQEPEAHLQIREE